MAWPYIHCNPLGLPFRRKTHDDAVVFLRPLNQRRHQAPHRRPTDARVGTVHGQRSKRCGRMLGPLFGFQSSLRWVFVSRNCDAPAPPPPGQREWLMNGSGMGPSLLGTGPLLPPDPGDIGWRERPTGVWGEPVLAFGRRCPVASIRTPGHRQVRFPVHRHGFHQSRAGVAVPVPTSVRTAPQSPCAERASRRASAKAASPGLSPGGTRGPVFTESTGSAWDARRALDLVRVRLRGLVDRHGTRRHGRRQSDAPSERLMRAKGWHAPRYDQRVPVTDS